MTWASHTRSKHYPAVAASRDEMGHAGRLLGAAEGARTRSPTTCRSLRKSELGRVPGSWRRDAGKAKERISQSSSTGSCDRPSDDSRTGIVRKRHWCVQLGRSAHKYKGGSNALLTPTWIAGAVSPGRLRGVDDYARNPWVRYR